MASQLPNPCFHMPTSSLESSKADQGTLQFMVGFISAGTAHFRGFGTLRRCWSTTASSDHRYAVVSALIEEMFLKLTRTAFCRMAEVIVSPAACLFFISSLCLAIAASQIRINSSQAVNITSRFLFSSFPSKIWKRTKLIAEGAWCANLRWDQVDCVCSPISEYL